MRLLTELKRRNVFRMAILYVVGAWLILQVGDLLFDLMGLPDWSLRIVLAILILGFPVALAFSWLYELTPEGLKREKDVDRSASITPQTGKKLNAITLIVALIAIGLVVFQQVQMYGEQSAETPSAASEGDRATGWSVPDGRTPEGETADGRKSIAVLPFDNFSEDPGNAFFASGVHEDVLTNLSRIDDLKVISRTSVEQYSDNRPPVSEIATALGVGHIVEGSVRRAGNRVRVTAQLIDASTDEHLWAESFDRDLTDVFAIQTEIAKAIATALEATLSENEEALISQRPTRNISAYDLYLKAREAIAQTGYSRQKYEKAEIRLKEAIDLDPDFALAHAMLAKVHGGMVWWWDRSEQRKRAAKAAAARAIELNPELPESRAALADYYYRVEKDYESAIIELEAAHERAPGNAEVLYDMGITYRRLGRWDEAIASFAESVELDPANLSRLGEFIQTLAMTRRWDQALALLDPVLREYPDDTEFAAMKSNILLSGYGDINAARRLLGDTRPTNSITQVFSLLFFHQSAREWEAIIALSEDPTARSAFRGVGLEAFMEEIVGHAYRALGKAEEATRRFQTGVELAERELDADSQKPWVTAALTQNLSNLERHDEAIAAIENVLEVINDEVDRHALRSTHAYALAKAGKTERALEEIQDLLETPNGVTQWQLKLDPRWDFLRDNKRFQALTEVEVTIR